MAWVTQKFEAHGMEVTLEENWVALETNTQEFTVCPGARAEAHAWAMMLRRAARRLEEIGKGLD